MRAHRRDRRRWRVPRIWHGRNAGRPKGAAARPWTAAVGGGLGGPIREGAGAAESKLRRASSTHRRHRPPESDREASCVDPTQRNWPLGSRLSRRRCAHITGCDRAGRRTTSAAVKPRWSPSGVWASRRPASILKARPPSVLIADIASPHSSTANNLPGGGWERRHELINRWQWHDVGCWCFAE